jgi:tRNA pseudouridine38-40 synthase
MPRYFLECKYKGTAYSGFQVQHNAVTVQSVLEEAMAVYFMGKVNLTGSSRTDAGVHARQNFFHFDREGEIPEKFLYNINAILPGDIAVLACRAMKEDAHCRFDAVSREYAYYLYGEKDPFKSDRAWFYPFPLDKGLMDRAAAIIMEYEDFTSFSKRNTQVKTFHCRIEASDWTLEGGDLVYRVRANRFLRGMVKGLVGTMLQCGRGKMGEEGFRKIIESRDCINADFTPPSHGLFLCAVNYPDGYFSL